MHAVGGRYRRSTDQSLIVQLKKQNNLNFKVFLTLIMFSRALLMKLNCLDFILLMDSPTIKFEFVKVYDNILQIRETGFTSRDPMFEKSYLLNR
jgi:hypothetical protein